MRFRSAFMYKRQDNIKVAHSLIQSRRFTDHEHYHEFYYTSIPTIMATAQIINCLVCMEPVRPRQQGVQCDGCFRWSHRICNTGISQEVYRAAVRDGTDIEWRCILCEHPNAESTMEPMENVSLPDTDFMQYVGRTWITNETWPPSSWSIFMKSVRTNNDIEGWHLGLNRRAAGKSQLPLYLLVSLLHCEARLTSIQIRLVSEKKLRRIQRKKFRNLQTKIFALWDEFNSGDRSARKLLKACSYLNGPAAS